MLDIREIRNNPEAVIEGLKKRNADFKPTVDKIVELDIKKRELGTENDRLKARQNEVSKSLPAMKKEGKDTTALMAEMKEISAKSKDIGAELSAIETEIADLIYSIPNIPDKSTPEGADSEQNVEVRRFGEPKKFDFEPKPHWEIGKALDILDPERAAKVTGSRFHFYKGAGARLERAIMNFYLDLHYESGYTEVFPPFMVNRASMTGTGQLPKFEEDMFKLEGVDYFLIPTAEVPVTNMYRDEILKADELPIKHCAFSACFRAEGGSAGRDTRGLIREHQFQKVELVKFTTPEQSFEELERLTADAERALQLLGLPYRTVALCGGDLGFSSAKTYDIEVWLPSYNRYTEISSCSNFVDYQARRANIKFRRAEGEKPEFVHTLNGSGLALGRTTAAVLENYQNADGTVTVPEVLKRYLNCDVIK